MKSPELPDPIAGRLRAAVVPERESGLRGALRRNKEQLFETLDAPPPAPRARRWLTPTTILIAVAAAGLLWAHGRPTLVATRHVVTASVAVSQASSQAAWDRHSSAMGERVSLHDGSLSFRTRGGGPKLRVVVPDGELEDLGTQFRVTVADGRTTSIEVTEGFVVFHRHAAADIRLPAGSLWQELVPSVGARQAIRPEPALTLTSPRHVPAAASSELPPFPVPADTGEDAAYLRIVALVREDRRDEARVAAQEYLRRFPNGFRRVEVEQLAR